MSPERFKGKADHRGDIYGLGVTLYELLALQKAFAANDRLQLIEQIANDEPRRLKEINRHIPLDLETIVMKAMDKEPRRRYQHGTELADDLRRFVNDQPIQARRASALERAIRWTRRNKALTAAMLSMLVAIAILIVGTILVWQQRDIAHSNFLEAEKQRLRANRAADSARLEAKSARQAVQKLLTAVGERRLRNVPYMDELRRQLLEDALELNRQFLARSDAESDRREVALAYQRVGEIYTALERLAEARDSLTRARDTWAGLATRQPDNRSAVAALAEVDSDIGDNLMRSGMLEEARVAAERAIGRFESLLRDEPDNADILRGKSVGLQRLAMLKTLVGDNNGAESELRKALAVYDQMRADSRQLPKNRQTQAAVLTSLGELLYSTRRPSEAVEELERARRIFQKLVADFPNERGYQESLGNNANFLGAYYLKIGKLKNAEDSFRMGIEILAKLSTAFPQIPDYRVTKASLTSGLATALAISGEQANALEKFRESAQQLEDLVDDFPKIPNYRFQAANAIRRLGVHYKNIGQAEQAIEPYNKAYAMMESLVQQDETIMERRIDLAELAFLNSTIILIAHPRDPRGEEFAERAVSLAEQVIEVTQNETRHRHKLAKYYVNLAEFRKSAGKITQAEELILKGIDQQRQLVADVPQYEEYRRLLAISMFKLSELYLSNKRLEQAKRWTQECIEVRRLNREKNPQRYDHPLELAMAYIQLGDIEGKSESTQPAVDAYRQAIVICRQGMTAFPENEQFRVHVMFGYEELSSLYQRQQLREDAKSYVDAANALFQREKKRDTPDQRVLDTWRRIESRWQKGIH